MINALLALAFRTLEKIGKLMFYKLFLLTRYTYT